MSEVGNVAVALPCDKKNDKVICRQENKVTQHQLGQIKQKLSKLSQKWTD